MQSETTMTSSAHLWAIGYDDEDRAIQVRNLIMSLAGPEHSLRLLEIAVVVRSPDGSVVFDGKPFAPEHHPLNGGILSLLAGFALAVPLLTDEAVARFFDSPASELSESVGINETFKKEIASMIRPGTCALLVLDVAENLNAILTRLRGLGGRILKSNVDIERAQLIQSTLAQTACA
jgi:uncharacterized membrane protein